MSGTFGDINVPPMLMAFGITTVDAGNVISTDFKRLGNYVYLIKHTHNHDYTPNVEQLKQNYDFIADSIENKSIISAFAVGFGGVAEAICKMSFGNELGVELMFSERDDYPLEKFEEELFYLSYGSVVVESTAMLNFPNAVYLGHIVDDKSIMVVSKQPDNATHLIASCSLDELYEANTEKFAQIYPTKK